MNAGPSVGGGEGRGWGLPLHHSGPEESQNVAEDSAGLLHQSLAAPAFTQVYRTNYFTLMQKHVE